MRKQTKFVAVLSAAALLAIGASMTSFAATSGWTEQDGTWVYLDKDQNRVTDTWKPSGNFRYYLDEDGYMATDKIINDEDNTYYVDTTGRLVTNQWVERPNEDYSDSSDSDNEPESVWYYFQASGKAYKGSDGDTVSFKDINGKKYAFDSDGKMLFGWIDDKGQRVTGDDAFKEGVYYCGDSNDGARVSNAWRQLYISDNGPGQELADQENAWFFFQINGKKMQANPDGKATKPMDQQLKTKSINGKTYAFDADGIMRAQWQLATEKVASEINGYYSDIDNGARKKGWFQAVPSESLDPGAYNDDSSKWYFALNNGNLVTSEIKTINGKKYAFDKNGTMMTGLYAMELKNSRNIVAYEKLDKSSEMVSAKYYKVASQLLNSDDKSQIIGDPYDKDTNPDGDRTLSIGVYYFSGSSSDGALKTGNQNLDVDGDTYQFSFKKDGSDKGMGITSKSSDKNLYIMGKKIKANTDYKYQVADRKTGEILSMTADVDQALYDNYCIINTSGSVMSGTSYYKDADGNYYHIVKDKDSTKTYIEYISQETKDHPTVK